MGDICDYNRPDWKTLRNQLNGIWKNRGLSGGPPFPKVNIDSSFLASGGLRHLLESAIEGFHPVNKVVGYVASGGLDTSSLIAIAANSGRSLITVSGVSDEPSLQPDRHRIELLKDMYGIKGSEIDLDSLDLDYEHRRVQNLSVGPILYPNVYFYIPLMEEFRKYGVGDVVDGFDGDTVVGSGKNYQLDLLIRGNFSAFFASGGNPCRLAASQLRGVPVRCWRRFSRAARAIDLIYPRDPAGTFTDAGDHRSRLRWQLFLDSASHLRNLATNSNINIKLPYLEENVINHCLKVDSSLKYRDGYLRWYQRKAFDDILPKEIAWNKNKTSFRDVFISLLNKSTLAPPNSIHYSDKQILDHWSTHILLRWLEESPYLEDCNRIPPAWLKRRVKKYPLKSKY